MTAKLWKMFSTCSPPNECYVVKVDHFPASRRFFQPLDAIPIGDLRNRLRMIDEVLENEEGGWKRKKKAGSLKEKWGRRP